MSSVVIGNGNISIEDVLKIARGATVELNSDETFRESIQSSRNYLDSLLASGGKVYGVNTGFGDSCTVETHPEYLNQLAVNITRYHGCGMGEVFDELETRAIQAVRLASLVRAESAVSIELLESLVMQLNNGISPRIPKEGSVGASGDLTPLSYLASSLIGEGTVLYQGEYVETAELYKKLDIKPHTLKPKEGLALMNGTAVMTALACLAFERAERLAEMTCTVTAMGVLGIKGNPYHYDKDLFLAKPHPGQMHAAARIAENLTEYQPAIESLRIQDRYSLRCAPHVLGVLFDMLPVLRGMIEVEANSANDNPLVFKERERVLHGGNFYGGHIAFAMDSLKNLVANVADLLDRQVALLVDPKFNANLPANLSGAKGDVASVSHGFKAVQIAISAWTAEALKACMPASVFSRSTECHNQDKVSMGTISARDCIRVLELTEQVFVASTMIATQALELREDSQEVAKSEWGEKIQNFVGKIREYSPKVIEDRSLEMEMRNLISLMKSGELDV